jgi:tetraacyldisaccharide 4'-kinase
MTPAHDRTERVLALMRGEGRGPKAALSRFGLWTLSKVYACGIGAYWGMYRAGLLRRVHLRPFVISVGNITVGGTGKTTTIQYLARTLADAGLRVVILSYGYRAADKEAVGIVSDGRSVLMSAEEAGDEAVLLARSLPEIPVLIGRRRVLSGAVAEERFHPDVLLCDDAFQYWRLHRDLDLLLVDAVEPWGHGHVLPRGLLREPIRQAARADAVVITHADLVPPQRVTDLRGTLRRLGFGGEEGQKPVWTARHAARGLSWIEGGAAGGLDGLRGLSVLAVSSLGDPASFEATLAAEGALVTPMRFPDHHRYTPPEIRAAEDAARAAGRRLVTTAKDAVKIRETAAPGAWWVLDIALELEAGPAFHTWVLKKAHRHVESASSSGRDEPR